MASTRRSPYSRDPVFATASGGPAATASNAAGSDMAVVVKNQYPKWVALSGNMVAKGGGSKTATPNGLPW